MTSCGVLSLAAAAPVCFYKAGTYNGLIVTTSGSGCGSSASYGGITGLFLGDTNVTENCTFNISPSVLGQKLQVEITAATCITTIPAPGGNFCEEASFSLNGSHYTVASSELDLTTPAGGTKPPAGNSMSINAAGNILGAGMGQTPGYGDGRGTVSLKHATAQVTSIDINHIVDYGKPGGSIYLVCSEDCKLPTGEQNAWLGWNSALPTLGQWKEVFTAPANVSFSGMTVREIDDPNQLGDDTCWRNTDATAPAIQVSGGSGL